MKYKTGEEVQKGDSVRFGIGIIGYVTGKTIGVYVPEDRTTYYLDESRLADELELLSRSKGAK